MNVQISTYVSEELHRQLEAYCKKNGIDKNVLIEDALLHHLQALREIPKEFIIPPRITLTESGMESLAELLEKPSAANAKLSALQKAS